MDSIDQVKPNRVRNSGEVESFLSTPIQKFLRAWHCRAGIVGILEFLAIGCYYNNHFHNGQRQNQSAP